MEQGKSVLVQCATLSDIENIVNRAIEAKMKDFYERIRQKPPRMVKRKDAARIIGVSLPTLSSYAKAGFLHPIHLGGRVFFEEDEILAFNASEPSTNISPLPSSSHSHETP